jgi:hypothetical protein
VEIEYTICQIQSGDISLAAKTHRRLNGDPRLDIRLTPRLVTWTLVNLVDGTPETLVGMPRRNHVDFYFLYENLKALLAEFPSPSGSANPDLRLPTVSSAGTERRGGKRVRIVLPVYRYPLLAVELHVIQAPSFSAVGIEPNIHMDVESTPAGLYGGENFEIHFGIQANFEITGPFSGRISSATIQMHPDVYATIHSDMRYL